MNLLRPFMSHSKKEKMKGCKYLTMILQEIGSPLCKCRVNNSYNMACFLAIQEKLNNDNVIPNGECPFAYREVDLSECPCFDSHENI